MNEKTLNNIYTFDSIISETIRKWFKLYQFKQPPENQVEKLTAIIRDTLINLIDEEQPFYLDDYCKSAIYYARFYVHSIVLLSRGYDTVNEFFDVDYTVAYSEELQPQVVEKSAKILIKALDDYYFNVAEFINNGTLRPENFSYLVRFILGDCAEAWEDEEIDSEELFLLVFQEKAYGFAKFMATYIAISSGEELRVKGNADKSTEEKVIEWIFNRGN